ncbi:tetratricopeptide repeat protein [Congregibacter variabilis]|uniref:Tetratricopeptide repeat protein n=1 Tax=Congregibacter variabilis TaxID=3081200 RepID=A0ABZ0I5M7_9GAMM|nr:tetratricopeptide repeat protein [Congregibacter sp. IMCC43200]
MSFLGELHRRNVVRMGIAYTVTAWLLLQVTDVVMQNIEAPPWVMQALLYLLVVGLVPTLLFAWVFELTPEGIKRESEIAEGSSVVHQTRRKLDTLIILVLAGALAYMFWDGKRSESAAPADVIAAQSAEIADESPGMTRLREQVAAADQSKPDDAAVDIADKSIAVLPFVNLSSDPEQEFFSDGISEELLNVLAQIPALRVAARTSSFQFKGDNRDISEIAEVLKVNHVLEGSVRKAGTRLRITAQLIEAQSGYHLWSETYDRELEDVFAIQDEISLAIAEALKAELALNDDGRALLSRETANTPAYEAYLKGRGLINQRGNQAITAGVRELERSVRLDANFAPARAQLAIGVALLQSSAGAYGDLSADEVKQRAGEQIAAAAALDDDFAELWAARSIMAAVQNDAERALEYAERALAIRPNYADALTWRVNALGDLGRYAESFAAREELLDLDPLSVIGRLNAVTTLRFTEPERATIVAQSLAAQSPWASHLALARVYVAQGEVDLALEQFLLAYAADASDLFSNLLLSFLYSELGLIDEGLRVAREAQPWVWLFAGQFDKAEGSLREALALNPGDLELRSGLGSALYYQGRYQEAVAIWQTTLVPSVFGEIVSSWGGNLPTAQFVYSLRQLGEYEAAEPYLSALDAHESAFGELIQNNAGWQWGQGLIAALRNDRKAAIEELQRSVSNGMRDPTQLQEPILSGLFDEPAMQVMRETVATRNAQNREKALTLICKNNPVPDSWRPLDATCAGF